MKLLTWNIWISWDIAIDFFWVYCREVMGTYIMGYQTIETTETTTCYLGLPENRFIHSIAILEGRMMRNLADFGFSRFSPKFSQKQ